MRPCVCVSLICPLEQWDVPFPSAWHKLRKYHTASLDMRVCVCVCVWNMRLVVCSLVGPGCTLIHLFVVLNKDHLEDFLGSARFVYSRKANKSECTKRTQGKKHMASWRLFCFLWEFSALGWLNLTLCYDTDQQHRTVLFIWWFLKA